MQHFGHGHISPHRQVGVDGGGVRSFAVVSDLFLCVRSVSKKSKNTPAMLIKITVSAVMCLDATSTCLALLRWYDIK
jgi:hypothetical protein